MGINEMLTLHGLPDPPSPPGDRRCPARRVFRPCIVSFSPTSCGNWSPDREVADLSRAPQLPSLMGLLGSEQDGGSSSSTHGTSPLTPCLTLFLPDQDPGSGRDMEWNPLAGGSSRGKKGGQDVVWGEGTGILKCLTHHRMTAHGLSCHRRALWPHSPFFRQWISGQHLKIKRFPINN